MSKRKHTQEDVNRDATPQMDMFADRREPAPPTELSSVAAAQPESLPDRALESAIEVIVSVLGDANYRIVRRKVKVQGVWYNVEVSK